MKVIKFQQGGAWATFTPLTASQPAAESSKESSSGGSKKSISSMLDDETYKKLIDEGGLVSDINKFTEELARIEENTGMDWGNPQGQAAGRVSSQIRMIARVNELRENKRNWDAAVTVANQLGGYSEVAVGSNQEVFFKDKNNKVNAISLPEYQKNKDKIRLLTVAEVMYERNHNNQLANNNAVFSVAHNAIGINKILTNISNFVKDIGSETTSITKTYSKGDSQKDYNLLRSNIGGRKPSRQEADALQQLDELIHSPGDYSEIETKTINSNKYISTALSYIWNGLDQSSKAKLQAVATMNGVNNPQQYILDMLKTNKPETYESKTTPKELPGTSAASTAKSISLTPQELFHNDKLYMPGMTYDINDKTGKTLLKVTSTGKETLMSLDNNDVIKSASMDRVLNNSGYSRILNKSQMYIGDTKVDETLLPEIAFTGEDVGKVYLPVRGDGTPDFAKIDSFNKAYQEFEKVKDSSSKAELEEFFRKKGFSNVKITETAAGDKIIAETGAVRPFLAMPIITNSASEVSDLPWMLKSTGDKADRDELLMQEAFTVTGGTPAKPTSAVKMPSGIFSLETPYRGVMFIAYRPSSSAILSSMAGHVKGTAATETDINRNLQFSSGMTSPAGINGDASRLNF